MRIACLGGGPAGIYFAISMKLRNPAHEVEVFERNRSGDTFGWGVVFSDQTLENLTRNDPASAATIASSFAHWDDIEVAVSGQSVVSSGHGFIGIGRKRLLRILQDRARELGVVMHFETEFDASFATMQGYDLIVAADGVNSQIRTAHEERFKTDIQTRANKFTWLGTTKLFDAFAFLFEETEAGWIWAHAYRFDETHSTFIVECAPDTWERMGFDAMSPEQSVAKCEAIFARYLDGNPLISNSTHLRGSAAWINFRRVLCENWHFDNVVLLGDAAHTAHFSIGSGTKLALEDAILLAEVMNRPGLADKDALEQALADYQAERHVEVLKIQNSARNSTEWFEALDRYMGFELPQFAYSLMTRSQRVSHENLRLRDPAWLEGVERWFARGSSGGDNAPLRPMFTPFTLRDLTLANRIAIPAMLTYAADADGRANEFHSVHYGGRALGGAGLIVTEMLAVSLDGRATSGCPGLYDDAQVAAWKGITDFAHRHGSAKLCAQLGHAGARAACRIPDGGRYDVPLDAPWPIRSASARPWKADGLVPAAMSEADMAAVRADFVAATGRAEAAGFDMIELQAGHGFLLSSFITPVMNHRDDDFGGSLDNRLRFPLSVVEAVRAAWPEGKPLAVRISATDWVGEGGITPADAVEIARRLKALGVDIVDVSAGETDPAARPVFGRMFQTPFADRVRNEAGIATMAVGNITDADQVNSILTAGRADLVALGRPHLANPMWTAHAAAEAQHAGFAVAPAYQLGQQQLLRAAQQAQEAGRA
ncbi:MAG: bifunctional salicylyl-CoA 5-hydroxylase/oxidoreductase [Sphingobium sp.]